MELLGRWTQDSRKDCDNIGLAPFRRLPMPAAVTSPDRGLRALLCLVVAAASILALTSGPAAAQSAPAVKPPIPSGSPQAYPPTTATPTGGISPEQVPAILDAQQQMRQKQSQEQPAQGQ